MTSVKFFAISSASLSLSLLLTSGCQSTQQPDALQSSAPLAEAAEVASAANTTAEFTPFDRNLSGFDYPFPVAYYSFRAQGQDLQMAYMDVRPQPAKANGKTVVLLHGKNFPAAYWKTTIEALVADGYRVVAPDQIGFGKSTKPEHLQYTFQALATWTHALLGSLGLEHYSVVGHSMGGMLATRYALLYPQNVTALALVNPIGLEDWKTLSPYRSVDEWYASDLQLTPEKIRNYQKRAYFDGNWQPQYDEAIIPQAGWTLHPDSPIIAWNSALHYDMIFTQPVLYEFGNLKMPVLLLIGTRDRTALGRDRVSDPEVLKNLGRYDRLGKSAAKAIPNATLIEFDDVGHVPQVEIFDQYISELEHFLGNH